MKPDLYFFNPTCELAVANESPYYMAPAKLRQFEKELGALPGLLASPHDYVLTHQPPTPHDTDRLQEAGFQLPQYLDLETALSDADFQNLPKGALIPWGWSPVAHQLLAPLKPGCSEAFNSLPISQWQPIHRELYSRTNALAVLSEILNKGLNESLLPLKALPVICTNHDQIIAQQQRWGKVVVKSPWSSSGRGLQVLRPGEYNQTNRQVITGFLKQQGCVMVEPWHNKIMDLSFQFYSHGDGTIEARGITSFMTDHTGHYLGNYVTERPPFLPQEVKEFLDQQLKTIKQSLWDALIKNPIATDYAGWFGVDAMVYTDESGWLKFHPCVEINCRLTMGAITLKLRDHLAEHSTGMFQIINGRDKTFEPFCNEQKEKFPLMIEDRKIVSGFLPLTPVDPESASGAYLIAQSD